MGAGALWGLLLALVCIPLEYVRESGFGISANSFQISSAYKSESNPLVYFLPICLLGPVLEELIFRHLVFGQIKRINRAIAYIFTALLFALLHLDYAAPILTELSALPIYVLSSLVFAYSYEKNGLCGSICSHSVNNIVAFFMVLSF